MALPGAAAANAFLVDRAVAVAAEAVAVDVLLSSMSYPQGWDTLAAATSYATATSRTMAAIPRRSIARPIAAMTFRVMARAA